MDFNETRKWIENKMRRQGVDDLDFGGIAVSKDFAGQMMVQTETGIYSMDRLPFEVFNTLSASIENYNSLSTNGDIRGEILPG